MVEQNNIRIEKIMGNGLERIGQAILVLAEQAEKQRDYELVEKLRSGLVEIEARSFARKKQ